MTTQFIATWRYLDPTDSFEPFKVMAFDSTKQLETYCHQHWEYLDTNFTTFFPFTIIEVAKDNHEVLDQFNIYVERTY